MSTDSAPASLESTPWNLRFRMVTLAAQEQAGRQAGRQGGRQGIRQAIRRAGRGSGGRDLGRGFRRARWTTVG
jgi:hypothetical protein